MDANTNTTRTENAKGFAVKTPFGVVGYHVERMLAAIELALATGDDFAATLAAAHARDAAHAIGGTR